MYNKVNQLCVYIYLLHLEPYSHPPNPTPVGHQRAPSWAPRAIEQVPTNWASLVAQTVKNLPEMKGTQAQFLGWENPLEKGMATHSSVLAWRIPWTEEPGGVQSMGWQSRTGTRLSRPHCPFCLLSLPCPSLPLAISSPSLHTYWKGVAEKGAQENCMLKKLIQVSCSRSGDWDLRKTNRSF